MFIQIGRRADPNPADVVGALLDCHARIRAFSGLALKIAQGEGAARDIAEAAARVERYFRVALPLHVADEELSLRPRLLASPVDPSVLRALDAMSEEHIAIELLVADLLPRWRAIAAEPPELLALAAASADASADLYLRFEVHLEQEERVVFPAIAEHLAASVGLIRAEMAARRGATSPPSPQGGGP